MHHPLATRVGRRRRRRGGGRIGRWIGRRFVRRYGGERVVLRRRRFGRIVARGMERESDGGARGGVVQLARRHGPRHAGEVRRRVFVGRFVHDVETFEVWVGRRGSKRVDGVDVFHVVSSRDDDDGDGRRPEMKGHGRAPLPRRHLRAVHGDGRDAIGRGRDVQSDSIHHGRVHLDGVKSRDVGKRRRVRHRRARRRLRGRRRIARETRRGSLDANLHRDEGGVHLGVGAQPIIADALRAGGANAEVVLRRLALLHRLDKPVGVPAKRRRKRTHLADDSRGILLVPRAKAKQTLVRPRAVLQELDEIRASRARRRAEPLPIRIATPRVHLDA